MTSLSCAQAEVLLAARAVGADDTPLAALVAHLTTCDLCLILAREMESVTVVEALAEACEAATDLLDLTVVPRDHYARGKEIGRGGMGRIVRARDRRLGRSVAIKELLDERLRARFEREARLTARLQHPAIVSVHEAGRWPSGEPFYAMKYVAGKPLHRVLAEKSALAERLSLLPNLITVVEAMAYAHSERVIHRDLKPGNILVGAFGETVVIDWGIAKDLNAPEVADALGVYRADPSSFTAAGAGTPEYMPPEQTRGDAPDERVDVYALGATLHYLLAGAPPGRAPLPDETPTELRAVVAKATAADRADRYPTAAELAEELKRFQTGQLVSAHRYTLRELSLRWLRRHRTAILVVSLSLTALAVVGVVSVVRIVAAEKQARERATELTLRQATQAVNRDPAEAVDWLRTLSLDARFAGAARLVALRARSMGLPIRIWGRGAPQVNDLAVAPDGHTLLVGDDQGKVRILDLGSDSAGEVAAHKDVGILAIRSLGKEGRFATAAPDGTARIWEPTYREQAVLAHPGGISAMDTSPDGETLATGGEDGVVRIWSRSGVLRAELAAHGRGDVIVRVSLDGRSIVSGGGDGKVRLWSVQGEPIHSWDAGGAVAALAFSIQSTRLAAGGADGRARVWETDSGRLLVDFDTGGPIRGLAFGSTGWLGVAGVAGVSIWNGQVRRLSAETDQEVLVACDEFLVSAHKSGHLNMFDVAASTALQGFGHYRAVTALVCLPDHKVASAGEDGTVRVWRLEDPTPKYRRQEYRGQAATGFAVSSDGEWLALLFSPGVLRLVGLHGRADRYLPVPGGSVRQCAFSGDARRLAVIAGPDVYLYDLPGGAFRALPRPFSRLHFVQFSPDGTRLAGASRSGLAIWDLNRGTVETYAGWQIDLAFAPDGQSLVTAGEDGVIRLRNLAAGTSEVLGGHEHRATNIDISPDGGAVASTAKDGSVLRFDLASHRETLLGRHNGQAVKVRFSPSGERIASAGSEGTILVWPRKGGAPVTLRAEASSVKVLSFSPDGRRLVTGVADGTIRLWDIDSGWSEILGTFPSPPDDAGFTPDGQWVGAIDTVGTVRLWPDAAPTEPRAVETWIAHLTSDDPSFVQDHRKPPAE